MPHVLATRFYSHTLVATGPVYATTGCWATDFVRTRTIGVTIVVLVTNRDQHHNSDIDDSDDHGCDEDVDNDDDDADCAYGTADQEADGYKVPHVDTQEVRMMTK